jgi:hypothetical protein
MSSLLKETNTCFIVIHLDSLCAIWHHELHVNEDSLILNRMDCFSFWPVMKMFCWLKTWVLHWKNTDAVPYRPSANLLQNLSYQKTGNASERSHKNYRCCVRFTRNIQTDHVKSFQYHGTIVNGNNTLEEKVRERIVKGNNAFYANINRFKSNCEKCWGNQN